MIEAILASAIGTLTAIIAATALIAAIIKTKKDQITGKVENKVDEKVEEKKEEMIGGMFQ